MYKGSTSNVWLTSSLIYCQNNTHVSVGIYSLSTKTFNEEKVLYANTQSNNFVVTFMYFVHGSHHFGNIRLCFAMETGLWNKFDPYSDNEWMKFNNLHNDGIWNMNILILMALNNVCYLLRSLCWNSDMATRSISLNIERVDIF